MLKSVAHLPILLLFATSALAQSSGTGSDATAPNGTRIFETPVLGGAVEKEPPLNVQTTPWQLDPSELPAPKGDHIETKKVVEKTVRTVKLQNVLPPIHFGSGEAKIPEGYIDKIRTILAGMKDRQNVRLHLIGYTDNVPLRPELAAKYGDNNGLARERAGVAAEFFQKALNLPPESVTYEGRGESEPVASNDTAKGRALNRRLEIEVWYDEIDEKPAVKQVVVHEKIKRIKVCRIEQVCRLTYKAGHAKRTRVKNLVPPLHYDDETTTIPPEYPQKLRQVLDNLRNKQNVVVKFIGYTDNTPLTGRDERIYGNQVGISKARARRVALAMQDALHLPSSAVDSDGRGAKNPIAPNDTEVGRSANRRIEVEFWYDDPLAELPTEPQLCPEAPGAETVTRVYHSPDHTLKPVPYVDGKPQLPEDYAQTLASVLAEVKDKSNVRVRFIGYIGDTRLERRTALAYGDDIGLSSARARRVMELVQKQLGLKPGQVEFEGRGYVQSNDVVNNGFVESQASRVEVQVVYDELAVLDDQEGLDITRITREVKTQNPYALNLMRITVDGKPLDDPGKSVADVERCTDVALDKARIQFKFDNLQIKPRLNVTAWPNTIRFRDDPATDEADERIRFKAYSNFHAFIAKAEVRIFEVGKSLRDTPLAVVPMDKDGQAQWRAGFKENVGAGRELRYVLRVYDKDGNFDETAPQKFWVLDRAAPAGAYERPAKELMAGYGENRLVVEHIPLRGGIIKVYGEKIPPGYTVSVAGRKVPVSERGKFVTEEMLPPGLHTVQVAVLDASGNGEIYLRDLDLEKNDWFYVGMADVTAARTVTSGPANLLDGESGHYDDNRSLDGRLAFYTDGKFGDDWQLTASADTREGPVKDLFSNFTQKTPDAIFRRINPDYYYPTYGDDSTTEETAPTLGKFYAKLRKGANYGLWGDFKIGYTDNSLAHVDRSLYGANLHLEPSAVTSFGEKRFVADGYAAEPGTVAGRDEFLGTGGSLYYLRHQDIVTGSERLRIEYRDKVSGMVVGVKNLTPALDYSIDYLQGRVLLVAPLSPTVSDGLLVASDTSSGNEAYLVARYEYSTGFEQLDNLTTGGRVHYWLGDHVKLGFTGNKDTDPNAESELRAVDVTLRRSADTWLKLESSTSSGLGSPALASNDGGFNFTSPGTTTPLINAGEGQHGASRIDTSIGLKELNKSADGKMTFYRQTVEAGYSAPGLIAPTDTEQYGGTVKTTIADTTELRIKSDKRSREQGLQTTASEVNVDHELNTNWRLGSGLRVDKRTDRSPVVPLTQVQGSRTDAVVRATYDSRENWSSYGFVQGTVKHTGNRETNGRVGSGGSYQFSDRLKLKGEVSSGDMGPAASLGTEYLLSDRTTTYANYALENERTDNGVRAHKGNLTTGAKMRYSDTLDIFAEEKYSHGDVPTGLTQSTGIQYAPTDRWNYSGRVDVGALHDPLTGAEMKRNALSLGMGYGFEAIKLSSLLEFRRDDIQSPADLSVSRRKSFLTKNSLKYQSSPDWRIIARLNYSNSTSSLGDMYSGTFTEGVLGYGFRPVASDRLNMLLKYTYFYNLPAAGQVTVANTATAYIQKSNIFSVDAVYDVAPPWSVGGKYAHKVGQVSQDRVNPVFFDSTADLYIARIDWHLVRKWDFTLEGRRLSLPEAGDVRAGALVGLYKHLSENIKLGAGWNFTNFSDDLTDLSYRHRGFFVNVVGKI